MKPYNRDFFEKIGDLFYAVAADRDVQPLGYSELKMIVSGDWMEQPQDAGLPIPENVHVMFVEMDSLKATDVPSAEAYNNFITFFNKYPEMFTAAVRDKILETVSTIDAHFSSKRVATKDHLSELIKLLGRKKTSIIIEDSVDKLFDPI